LRRVIEGDPHTVGGKSATWTTRLLAAYLGRVTGHRTGIATVRLHLHAADDVCTRPTWTLQRPGGGARGLGKKRLPGAVLLAAAALPSPPPLAALLPDLTGAALLAPADPSRQELLALLPRAAVSLPDEGQIALHPTLTRVGCRRGRRGQRRVPAPGTNQRKGGFGAGEWRAGWVDWAVADKRAAAPFCAPLRRLVARAQQRGRIALVVLDNLGLHTVRGSTQLRAVLAGGSALRLVDTPSDDPESNRIAWLWALFRDAVPHNHQRPTRGALLQDAEQWVQDLRPVDARRHIGSPGAARPVARQGVQHAA
jgi:hypothetical protein